MLKSQLRLCGCKNYPCRGSRPSRHRPATVTAGEKGLNCRKLSRAPLEGILGHSCALANTSTACWSNNCRSVPPFILSGVQRRADKKKTGRRFIMPWLTRPQMAVPQCSISINFLTFPSALNTKPLLLYWQTCLPFRCVYTFARHGLNTLHVCVEARLFCVCGVYRVMYCICFAPCWVGVQRIIAPPSKLEIWFMNPFFVSNALNVAAF